MIKIILIDDHSLVRAGMRRMLQETKEIQIVGEADTGQAGIELAQEKKPDIIVLDFKLPDLNGLDVTNALLKLNPDVKILIVSAAVNTLFPFQLLEAGAQGYLSKDSSQEEFIQAIQAIKRGERVISRKIANQLALAKTNYQTNTLFSRLSTREMEVMMMLIQGTTIKKIADHLAINLKTVHTYRTRIFEKLNIDNDISLTLLAIRHQLIKPL